MSTFKDFLHKESRLVTEGDTLQDLLKYIQSSCKRESGDVNIIQRELDAFANLTKLVTKAINVKEEGDKERRLFLDVQNIRDELRGIANQLEDSAIELIKDLKKYIRELE